MALAFTSGSPVPTQTTGMGVPLKSPPGIIANELCTWTAVNLPKGLSIEEGPSLSARIIGTPTTIETRTEVRVKAENLAKSESKETTNTEWKVVEAEFNSVGGVSLRVEEVDKPTGEGIEDLMKTGSPFKTTDLAQIAVLTSASLAGIVERLN